MFISVKIVCLRQPNLIYLNLCASLFHFLSLLLRFAFFGWLPSVGCQQQLHKEIALIRDNEITESLYKETIDDGRKNVVKLENRLDVITKRCGSVMAENAKLREIIDHMLQER